MKHRVVHTYNSSYLLEQHVPDGCSLCLYISSRQTNLKCKLGAVNQLAKAAQNFVLQAVLEAAFQCHAFIADTHWQNSCCHLTLVMLVLQSGKQNSVGCVLVLVELLLTDFSF